MKNKNIKLAIATCLILGFAYRADAQTTSQKIGTNPTTKDASAILELEATNKGVLFPRVTLTSSTDVTTVPNAVNALTVFNTQTLNDVTAGYYYWSVADNRWIRLTTEQGDLRAVGYFNHVSQDAGIGSNGTNLGTRGGNIAIGGYALSSNYGGGGNIALGQSNLILNTTGSGNIAIGGEALYNNDIGYSNIGVGGNALHDTKGDGNTALGSSAGSTLKSGDNNIFIGQNVQPNISMTSSNQLNIGNWIYGNNGKIGINEPAPNSTLSVAGSISTAIRLVSASTMLTENDHTIIISNPIAQNSPFQMPFPANSVAISLPQASTCKGRVYEIYNASGSYQRLLAYDGILGHTEIKASLGDGFSPGTYYDLGYRAYGGSSSGQGTYYRVQSDGVVWWVLF
jgi:hypothetical protein